MKRIKQKPIKLTLQRACAECLFHPEHAPCVRCAVKDARAAVTLQDDYAVTWDGKEIIS